jgi:hypothetical protein
VEQAVNAEQPAREPEPEPETVACPECGLQATVLVRFTNAGVEYLRIRCTGSLTMLVAAHQIRQHRLRSA